MHPVYSSLQIALIGLTRLTEFSLDLLEAAPPAPLGPAQLPLWQGVLARRRRAAVILRETLSPQSLSQMRRMAACGVWRSPSWHDDLAGTETALLAQFDAALALPDLPQDLHASLRNLRAEAEQTRLLIAALSGKGAGRRRAAPVGYRVSRASAAASAWGEKMNRAR